MDQRPPPDSLIALALSQVAQLIAMLAFLRVTDPPRALDAAGIRLFFRTLI